MKSIILLLFLLLYSVFPMLGTTYSYNVWNESSGYDYIVCIDSVYYRHLADRTAPVKTLKPHVVIPDSITVDSVKLPINEIDFQGDSILVSVEIPSTVTFLDSYSFKNCKNLRSVKIPNSVTSFDYYTFFGCEKLISISIPISVTSIGSFCFKGCKSLKNISIPENVLTIGDGSFEYCENLDTIFIEKGDRYLRFLTDAQNMVFFKSGIHTMVVGRDIYSPPYPYGGKTSDLPESYFWSIYKYQNVKNFVIPDDSDCPRFFYYNYFRKSIETMSLGKNLKAYPVDCTEWTISKLTLHDVVPPKCPKFTDEQFYSLIVNVPEEALDAYRNADGWKNFHCLYSSDIDQPTIYVEKIETARFDLQGRPVSSDYSGLVIIRYSDGSAKKVLVKN